MPVFRLQPIGKPNLKAFADEYRKQFDASLDEMGKVAVKKYEAATENWKHKPQFRAVRTKNTVAVSISGANAKQFMYVDQGTRPHVIRAKNRRGKRGLLTFRTGYQPKTRPNNTVYRGSGQSTGPWRSKQAIKHPGTKPRNFTRIITNQMREEGRAIIRRRAKLARIPR